MTRATALQAVVQRFHSCGCKPAAVQYVRDCPSATECAARTAHNTQPSVGGAATQDARGRSAVGSDRPLLRQPSLRCALSEAHCLTFRGRYAHGVACVRVRRAARLDVPQQKLRSALGHVRDLRTLLRSKDTPTARLTASSLWAHGSSFGGPLTALVRDLSGLGMRVWEGGWRG